MGRVYCCATGCHNNSETEGVTLHRIPADKKLRAIWLSRISRSKFTPKSWTRLCSQHFRDGLFKPGMLPTIFGHKIFKLSKLGEYAGDKDTKINEEDVPGPVLTESIGNGTMWAPSLLMHDYTGPVEFRGVSASSLRESGSQTTPSEDSTPLHVLSTESQTDVCSKDTGTSMDTIMPDLNILDMKDKDIRFYTGVSCRPVLLSLFDLCLDGSKGRKDKKLKEIDEFLMVLIKLRLNLLLQDLAFRFKVSKAYVSRVFTWWIPRMETKLAFLCEFPSKELCRARRPVAFDFFGDVRAIIDCTEIYTETPSGLQEKAQMYSNYKSHMTWKVLIAISPFGTISFVSDLYGGNTSDKEMVIRSNFLDLMERGDGIMADKGFLIHDICTERGIFLCIPPRKTNTQFNPADVEKTRRIANLRIHVKRAMERIKNFRILTGHMPLIMSSLASKIIKICCYLCNLQPPLIEADKQ